MRFDATWCAFKVKMTLVKSSVQTIFKHPQSTFDSPIESDIPFDPIIWSTPTVCKLEESVFDCDYNSLSDCSNNSDESSILTPSSSPQLSISRTTSLSSSSPLFSIMKKPNRSLSCNSSHFQSNKELSSRSTPQSNRNSNALLGIIFPFEVKSRRRATMCASPTSLISDNSQCASLNKNFRFNEAVVIYETYNSEVYPRDAYGDPEFSAKQIRKLNKEIKKFKLREMPVHPDSVKNTTLSI